jgi:hypothetical protein
VERCCPSTTWCWFGLPQAAGPELVAGGATRRGAGRLLAVGAQARWRTTAASARAATITRRAFLGRAPAAEDDYPPALAEMRRGGPAGAVVVAGRARA